MSRYLFSPDFFKLYPRAAGVELSTAERVWDRTNQMEERLEFIREKLPNAEFCSIFTRDGTRDIGTRVTFYFASPGDAAFFKLGASDL